MHICRKLSVLFFGAAVLASSACSDEDPASADGGTVAQMDAADDYDGGIDAGRPDSGLLRPEAGVDAGVHHCTTGDNINFSGAEIAVGAASTQALNPQEGVSDLSCLDVEPDDLEFQVAIFIRGCVTPIGAALTRANLDSLEVAVFRARDGNTMVDPSFDAVSGSDHRPDQKIDVGASFDSTIATSVCASGVQLEIGFNETGTVLRSEEEYIVRIRTATAAPQQVAPPTYYFGVIGRNDNLGGAPLELDLCSASQCYLRHNFVLPTTSALSAAITAAPTPVPGSANLRDGLGAGYGIVEANDCDGIPMTHAVAGFNPAPINDGYVGDMVNAAATETTDRGLYIGLGFPGQAATASTAIQVAAAVGAKRDDSCTEEFAGSVIVVFPDSVSVYRSSSQTVLHGL
jgi:hypothetical protein